jgi:hypothetical protein
MQQDLLANGNYAPYLAHTLTPPMLGASGMTGGYAMPQGIGINPAFGQFGQAPFGQAPFGQGLPGNAIPYGPFSSQPGTGPQGLQPFGAQHQTVTPQQQQQFAATIHHLAHQAATLATLGQQVGGTLQQLAQYVTWQGAIGHQIAGLLNQFAQQCAWQAAQSRPGGWGMQYGQQPFGQTPFGQAPFGQAAAFNRLF